MDIYTAVGNFPKDQINKIKIRDKTITFPLAVDPKDFYTNLKDKIVTDKLSAEKAIYAASIIPRKQFKSFRQLLLTHISFSDSLDVKQSPRGF